MSTILRAAEEPLCTVPPLPPLKNRYFALRHGQSTANIAMIISSLPALGRMIHGLTDEGKTQAKEAAADILAAIGGPEEAAKLVVYSSDFLRARETAAESVAAIWEGGLLPAEVTAAAPPPAVNQHLGLRERWFGQLDGNDVKTYNEVWPLDLEDAHHTTHDVESVNSVAARVRDLILELEESHGGDGGVPILLSSHADTCQIMQCYMANADVRLFSQYRFKNGEVRALLSTPDSLPTAVPLERDVSRV